MSVAEIIKSVESLSPEEFDQVWQSLEQKRFHDLAIAFRSSIGPTAEISTPLDAYDAAASLEKFLKSRA
jgi:hypothetical protein